MTRHNVRAERGLQSACFKHYYQNKFAMGTAVLPISARADSVSLSAAERGEVVFRE